MIFSGPYSSLKAFKQALLFSGLFLCAWCEASETLICRVLSNSNTGTIYAKRWVTYAQGGMGGVAGDIMVYPELSGLNYASSSGYYNYWPVGTTMALAPYVYAVKTQSNLNITVDDSHVSEIPNIVASLNGMPQNQSAVVNGVVLTYPSDGGVDITVSHTRPGTVVGDGVATLDSNGNAVMSYPDSTGFVAGYHELPQGGYSPVWYDTAGVTSGHAANVLTSLNDASKAELVYDSTSGTYSFETPDYSSQISAIYNRLNNPFVVDLQSPITVNPEVTVTPDVTVNVTAPTQNDITVAIDNSDLIETVAVMTSLVDINTSQLYDEIQNVELYQAADEAIQHSIDGKLEVSGTAPTVDDTLPTLSQDEQGIVDVYTGWNTSIPGLSQQFDIGLDTIVGPIPQMGSSLDIGTFHYGTHEISLSLTRYASQIAWFRSACLVGLLILFAYAVWSIITQSLQV